MTSQGWTWHSEVSGAGIGQEEGECRWRSGRKGGKWRCVSRRAQRGAQHRGSRRVDPTRTRATKGPPGTGLAHKDGQRPLYFPAFKRGHQ